MKPCFGLYGSSKRFRVVAFAAFLVGTVWLAVGPKVAEGQDPDQPVWSESWTARPAESTQPPALEFGPGRNPLERVKVFIHFKVRPGSAEQALVKTAGGRIRYSYSLAPAIAAEIPLAAVEQLRRLPSVRGIEPVGLVYAIDAELDNAWGVKRIGGGTVHAWGNKGTGVKIAIIDSGMDYTHPDLNSNYAGGYDFVNDDSYPMDDNGHGTHVAGIVGAEDNGAGVVGVAPEARLYALKVLGADGYGWWDDVIAAVQWAADNDIDVTNNSYGSIYDPGTTVQEAFDNAAAAGVVQVAAAGNEGPGANTVIFPAQYDSVIAVAATDSSDGRASFSSTGPDVELAAPGVSVLSTYPQNRYAYGSGTSMASPHVAGTAALIIRHGIADQNGNSLINDEVRQRLQATADELGDPGRDSSYGFGLVDADEAANSPPTVTIVSPKNGDEYQLGVLIKFEVIATDPEEGDLGAKVLWTSSIDGSHAPGVNPFYAYLTEGTHIITAEVTDAGGLTKTSDPITITVVPAPQPTLGVSVSTDKPSYVNGQKVYITVTVKDNNGAGVGGASVRVDVIPVKGSTTTYRGTSNGGGVVRFTYRVNTWLYGKGTYKVSATATKQGYVSGSGSTTFLVK